MSEHMARRLRGALYRVRGFAELNRPAPPPLTRTTQQARYNASPGIAQGFSFRNLTVPYRAGRRGCTLVGTVALDIGAGAPVPASRPVRLYAQGSGLLLAVTRSDALGHYQFDGLDPDERYCVVSIDSPRQVYRAVIADNLTPEPMP